MSFEVTINLNSLRVIRDELNSTINHSAESFETFLADRTHYGDLQSSRDTMSQLGGTFRLLEYPGASLLADTMTALIDVIADPQRKTTDAMINALTHAYLVLPRYIEYITIKKAELPILVIPYVNELRVSHCLPLLPEHYFYQGEIPQLGLLDASSETGQLAILISTAPRLRHMYQTGLVGVISNPDSSIDFQFLRRSVERVIKLMGNHPQAEIWQIASAVLEAFASAKIEVNLNRKRCLADIEKLFRQLVRQGEEGLNTSPPEHLKKNLLFILMLVDSELKLPEIDSIREAYSLPVLNINDADIVAQRELMHGPSLDTIESVITALNDELRAAKDILEIASQNQGIEEDDQLSLKTVLARVADTLSVLNLQGPQSMLQEQLKAVEGWTYEAGSAEFLVVADAVLYVESALIGLDRRELTVDDLNRANAVARKKILASSQLAVAEEVVIKESLAGIALIKRAITSYVDSNFDTAHIANIASTLKTVRGGLYILNYNRAAAILKSCSDFIADHIEGGSSGDQRHQLLETLADALISLEYYLMELETSRDVNEKILEVAEESLSAIGFAVNR